MNFGIIGYNIGIQLANMRRNIIPKPVVYYLTFASDSAFTIATNNKKKNWNGTLYYSTDASTWSTWSGTSAISSAEHGGEQRLYMRGSGNSRITNSSSSYRWALNGSNIRCEGDIETLLDYESVEKGQHPIMGEYCYAYLFYNCAALVAAPKLPALILAGRCYSNMFYGCTGLAAPPELPSVTLTPYCYSNMFCGCTKIENAPELPATDMALGCYNRMFKGCTSLVAAPKLPATEFPVMDENNIFDNGCYQRMFDGCSNLTTIPALPATMVEMFCYQSMFNGCTKIMLSETQVDDYQTAYRIPSSGVGTTNDDALTNMFANTGGTFTGTPSINTTYYTSNTVV